MDGAGERKERQREKGADREWERKKEGRKVGRAPFKRERSEQARVVLLVAAVEGISCQNSKGRPVQMPEYEHSQASTFKPAALD